MDQPFDLAIKNPKELATHVGQFERGGRHFNGDPHTDARPSKFFAAVTITGQHGEALFMLVNAAGKALWASA